MLASKLEQTIQNLRYEGPRKNFSFAAYVERHKSCYQQMQALAKTSDYTAYDPGTRVRHFLNGITDPSLAQAKLSLAANEEKYGRDFDATVEYLTTQVSYQQQNRRLNVAAVARAPAAASGGNLVTKDQQGNDLEMPAVFYSPDQWAQLSAAQKTSVRKRRATGRGGRGCGNKKRNRRTPCSEGYKALIKEMQTIKQHVMAANVKKEIPESEHSDDRASANAKNPALTKNKKMEKE